MEKGIPFSIQASITKSLTEILSVFPATDFKTISTSLPSLPIKFVSVILGALGLVTV
jgi:hypothetical protein